DRDGANRHSEFGRCGRIHFGLSGDWPSRVAEIISRLPAAAGPQKARCRPRAAPRGARGEARSMPDALGSLARPAALAACLALTLATHAAAQQPLVETPATPEFMSRFDFQM